MAAQLLISEFLASNDSDLKDEDGDSPDWIELHNAGDATASLEGWYLTDDAANLTKWSLPDVLLEPGGYLVVYASGKDRSLPSEPLHTNFALNDQGEFLGLVKPDGFTIAHAYAPEFPPQRKDFSYGLPQVVDTLIAPGAAAATLIPNDGSLGNAWAEPTFDDSGWQSGTTGIGFEVGQQASVVAYSNNEGNVGTQNYGGSLGLDFVVNQPISITRLGVFDSNSDGLFRDLTAQLWTRSGNTGTRLAELNFTAADPGELVQGDRFKSLPTPLDLQPGDYPIVAYGYGAGEPNGNTGGPAYADKSLNDGDEAIVFVGGGRFGTAGQFPATVDGGPVNRYSAGTFEFSSPAYFDLIAQDLASSMYGINASSFTRIPFDVVDPAGYSSLTLRMKYDDGFVAYLNGVEVARRQAPLNPDWNAAATQSRSLSETLRYEDINITSHVDAFNAGPNVLAIHGLNAAVDDPDFLILPELVAAGIPSQTPGFFAATTPGRPNDAAATFQGFVQDLEFSAERGFYDTPFDVAITTSTADAEIRYTLDGSSPTKDRGMVYAGPISVAGLTTLRAAAFAEDLLPTEVVTHSYIFLDDVLGQPANPPGFPTTWNGVTPDYEFDQDPGALSVIAGDPSYVPAEYIPIIKDSLRSLPTMSITLDVDDLFGAFGIYSNPTQRGVAWERPASVEYILADGTSAFQINAGLRVMGGTSRNPSVTPKHSLRLLFKQEYGAGRLKYPLFPDSDITTFNTLALRGNTRDTWTDSQFGGSIASFLRDQMAKQTQLDMGQLATSGNFVHLYLNGLYWGLYNPTERPDAAFAADYLGGAQEDYDAVKFCCGPSAVDGSTAKWNELRSLATDGFSGAAEYQFVQGNDPDGTRNPALDVLLDVDNLIDYMIAGQYHASGEWPGNWYGVRDRTAASTGFKFMTWDNDLAFPGQNVFADKTGFDGFTSNTPGEIDRALRANAEYVMRFADRVHRHYFNGGALTVAANMARWQQLADAIFAAVIAESARWGDTRREPPYTRDAEWQEFQDFMLNTYFPQRSDVVLDQLRGRGLYPTVAAPSFNQHGGLVPDGFPLKMTAAAGAIYYTLDGSDPRLAGGAVAPGALLYNGEVALSESVTARARVLDGGVWSALNEARFFVNSATAGTLAITELNYHPLAATAAEHAAGFTDKDDFEFVELRNVGDEVIQLSGVRFTDGIGFDFSSSPISSLIPGATTVVVRNPAAFEFRYGAGFNVAGSYSGQLSNNGERLQLLDIADQVIHDFVYDNAGDWPERADGLGSSLVVVDVSGDYNDPFNWYASGEFGGTPDAAGSTTSVIARKLFYNESAWDGNDPASNPNDATAIAVDKEPLFAERSADFENYSSYAKGLNGVLIDVRNLADPANVSAADFQFRVGNSADIESWIAPPEPSVSVRVGEGFGGSERATLVWPAGLIVNRWLETTLRATAQTGLVNDDVFYFGSAIGDTGNRDAMNAQVDAFDFAAVRDHATDSVLVDSAFDLDRNQMVDGADLAIARDHATNFATSLRMIAPSSPPAVPAAAVYLVAAPGARRDDQEILSTFSIDSRQPQLRRPTQRDASAAKLLAGDQRDGLRGVELRPVEADLGTLNGNVVGGLNAEPDGRSLYFQHLHDDLVVDDDFLVGLAGQH